MSTSEVSIAERIEEARARLLTAHNDMMAIPVNSPNLGPAVQVYEARKADLHLLLTPKSNDDAVDYFLIQQQSIRHQYPGSGFHMGFVSQTKKAV